MEIKKILIVSASFFPKNSPRSFRTTELAKELARQGHEVTVYIPAGGFDYTDFIRETKLTIKDLGPLRFRTIELKGGRIALLFRRALKRMVGLLFEYPTIELMFKVAKRLKSEKGYDLLISIAVPFPIHWGVAKARSGKHKIAATWVADCGDPYMGNKVDSFGKPFYFKYLEKWFSRKSDHISVPFEALKGKFYEEFRSKMVVIPQGFRTQEIRLAEAVNNKLPTFAFAGSVIPGIRDFDLFFKVLKEVNLPFRFIIFTEQSGYFKPFQKQFEDQLELRRYMPRLDLLYEISKCDFLVNVDTIYDCQSAGTAFPSKLIDYAFTGRPILNICSNQVDEDTVRQFLSGNYKNRRIIDSENYKIENVSARFLQLAD